MNSYFKLNETYRDRTGTYQPTWIDETGIKVKYLNKNEEWIKQYPTAPYKKKRFISAEHLAFMEKMDKKIREEEAKNGSNKKANRTA